MPITITRTDFEKLDHMERHRRIGEGVVVVDDDWEEREIAAERTAARVKAELAEHNAIYHPTMKRTDFDALPHGERNKFISGGGRLAD